MEQSRRAIGDVLLFTSLICDCKLVGHEIKTFPCAAVCRGQVEVQQAYHSRPYVSHCLHLEYTLFMYSSVGTISKVAMFYYFSSYRASEGAS